MKKLTIGFIGLGNRGKDAYLPEFAKFQNQVEIVAVADPDEAKRKDVARQYGIPENRCFTSGEELLKQPKMADALCIATMDQLHVAQAIPALEKGYDLLLEKPVSPSLAECRAIQEVAHRTGRRVVVCHVLRYTPFYKKVKELLERDAIGQVISIQAIENVGYWHQAHSFVRGNWCNSGSSSPMILQKCCHDMDLYLWLGGKTSKRVSSLGDFSLWGSFGVLDNSKHLMVKDGKVLFSLTQDGYKEGIQYFNKLYKEGLLDFEVFTQDRTQYASKGSQEEMKVGVLVAYTPENFLGAERTYNDYIDLLPLKGPNGDQLWNRYDMGYYTDRVVITSANKHPEATIR